MIHNNGAKVSATLGNDAMRSIAGNIAIIADNYKVLIYNGLLDIIIAPSLTMNRVDQLKCIHFSLPGCEMLVT